MMIIKKQKNQRSKYQSINSNERALIIQYIKEYKYSTSHVSLITGHKISTIKAIYKVFKKEGRVQKKDKRDKILNVLTQVQIFMVDDINKTLINLGEEIKEFKDVKDDDKQVRQQKEQMVQNILQKKQLEILNLLIDQQAVENLKAEMNTAFEQKYLINEFSLMNPNPQLFLEKQKQIKFSRNKNEEKNSNINQIPLISNQFLNSQIFKILYEQHRLMKT